MIPQRWCSIDGKKWTTTVGEIKAAVWLGCDEKTYYTALWWANGALSWEGNYKCIKAAKSACIEAIEDAEDIADAEAVMNEPSEKIVVQPEDAYKPLWAVVAEDAEDDCWRRNRGPFRQVRYYLFLNRQDAENHKADGFKVVPVWGG